MRNRYQNVVNTLLTKPSNLYSIQLRPLVQDYMSSVVNPVFTINRGNDSRGRPLSPFYNEMHKAFPGLTLGQSDPHQTLVKAVLDALPEDVRTHAVSDEKLFTNIQDELTAKYIAQLPADIGCIPF